MLFLAVLFVSTQVQASDLVFYGAQFKQSTAQVLTGYHVELDVTLIEDGVESLSLTLPDSVTGFLHKDAYKVAEDGSVSWIGQWQDDRGRSPVFITAVNGQVSALIYADDRVFQIRPTDDGHLFEEIDQASFPECGGTLEPQSWQMKDDRIINEAVSMDMLTVDAMVMYSLASENAVGGPDGMTALIRNAIDITNFAFTQSQIEARVRLVHHQVVAYSETADLNKDLKWLKDNRDVARLRDLYGADVVGMIVENGGNSCGTAYLQRQIKNSFSTDAFHVTARACTASNLSLAHELAHNLGCEHDPGNTDAIASKASNPWSFGHYVNGSFRTVMSYAAHCSSGCKRMPYFSNSNVLVNGFPAGIANQRENYRTIKQVTQLAANFRPSKTKSLAVRQ